MSFAKRKPFSNVNRNKNRRNTQKKIFNIENLDHALDYRLEVIEQNLSRVCNQQDALLPLLHVVDLVPGLSKTDVALRNIQGKISEAEDKLLKNEEMMRNFQSNMANQSGHKQQSQQQFHDTDNIMRNFENLGQQVQNVQQNQLEMKQDFEQNIQESVEQGQMKVMSQLDSLQKQLETKMEKQRKDLMKSIKKSGANKAKNNYNNSQGNNTQFSQEDRDQLLNEIKEYIEVRINEAKEDILDRHHSEMEFLQKEVGILRCEMDLLSNQKREDKIRPYLEQLPQDAEGIEVDLKVNNLEQALNLHDLDQFNQENSTRLNQEFESFEETLDQLKVQAQQFNELLKQEYQYQQDAGFFQTDEFQNFRQDMDYAEEKYLNLKTQIEGSKKKYISDMRKIQEKMEKLNKMKEEAGDQVDEQELVVTESFGDKIRDLMGDINSNIDQTYTRLDQIEEKIKVNDELARELLEKENEMENVEDGDKE